MNIKELLEHAKSDMQLCHAIASALIFSVDNRNHAEFTKRHGTYGADGVAKLLALLDADDLQEEIEALIEEEQTKALSGPKHFDLWGALEEAGCTVYDGGAFTPITEFNVVWSAPVKFPGSDETYTVQARPLTEAEMKARLNKNG